MSDDGTINLREDKDRRGNHSAHFDASDEDAEFKIGHMGQVEPITEEEAEIAKKPYDKVKVKFDKFVNLVATHAYEDIFEKHFDEDIILSTDLLTDLANSHEEKQDRKMPIIFIVGIALGVFLTWILLKS